MKSPAKQSCRHDVFHRRNFLRLGALSAFGVSMWTKQHLTAAPTRIGPRRDGEEPGPQVNAAAKKCILVWLDGGPSHIDTFDPKPNAPIEVRGPFASIATSETGITVTELLPQFAKRMQHWAIIRSMTSPLGEHNLGTNYLMTGYRPTPAIEYPCVGSVVSHLRGLDASQPARDLPGHIAIPRFRVGGSNFSGNGFLPSREQPFDVGGDPAKPDFRVRDLDPHPRVSVDRLNRRKEFMDRIDDFSRQLDRRPDSALDSPYDDAYRLLSSSDARSAFDLAAEPESVRQRYGSKTIGQSCLLARRLIQRGVPFVTVNSRGWDTHDNAYTRLKEGYTGAQVPVGLVPSLDMALSGLVDDLADSGLLDETLIIVMGEFGRTPKLNTSGGRDHWPRVFSVALAGAGIAGGQIIGASDRTGESPADSPVTPGDLASTVYTLLGFDPQHELITSDGRPIRLSRDGKPIESIIG